MNRTFTAIGTVAAAAATFGWMPAGAEEVSQRKLGEHPAVVAARIHANAGYDYASKMYRHPAGLELLAAAPREMGHHPAVIVHRQWSQRGYDYAANMYRHPAGLALLAEAPRERGDHPAVLIAKAASRQAAEQPQLFASHPALSVAAATRNSVPAPAITTVGFRGGAR